MDAFSPVNAGFSVLAGSLTTLSPCVLPLLPLVVGGAMQKNRYAPVLMGSGMVVSFALMGMLLGVAGASLGLDADTVRVGGAVLLVLLGLAMLVPQLNGILTRLLAPVATGANRVADGLDGGSPAGAFLLGAVLGLVWSPCSGPLLGSILTLVASQGGAVPGAVLLGLFGLGAALPLVAVAYASRSSMNRARGWLMQHGDKAKKVFGAIILLAGLAILTGADKWLEARILNLLPEAWVGLTTRF